MTGDVVRSQIVIIDDHAMFREGLAALLGNEPDLEVVIETGNPADAVAVISQRPIDLVLLDVLMPDVTGVSLASQLTLARPGLKVLGLSALSEPCMIASMLRAGATGYALKTQPARELTGAIRAVLAGERYLPPRVVAADVISCMDGRPDEPLRQLTRREREIFDLLIRGQSNDDIATRLFIARRTVETHRQRIMKKLATHSLVEMIRLAARLGALYE